jgi:hypothetical protein
MVTGVTVVTGPKEAQKGSPGDAKARERVPERKRPKERAVKAKVGVVCLFEKGKK